MPVPFFSVKNAHFFFLPLDFPTQKRKSPVKSFATIGGACTLYWAFYLRYLLTRGKRLLVLIIKIIIPQYFP